MTEATARDRTAHTLLTADQRAVDEVALSLLDEPAVKAARAEASKIWMSHPAYQQASAQITFEGAVDEAVYLAVRSVVAYTPATPKVIWTSGPGYSYGDLRVPGAASLSDNPDRIYRLIAADASHTYVVRGKLAASAVNPDFSFEAIPTVTLGPNTTGVLNSKDIDVADDGTFTLTVDSTPTDGRRNHLPIDASTKTVLARETIADWTTQLPTIITMERTDDAEPVVRTREELVGQAAAEVVGSMVRNTVYLGRVWDVFHTNQMEPRVREANQGMPGSVAVFTRYSVSSEEALVITVHPQGAGYVNVQLCDPWLRSILVRDHTSGLSDQQATPNADGSLTFVISVRDPGYWNWLDPAGLGDGVIQIRVEDLPDIPEDATTVVPDCQLVDLGGLSTVVPSGMREVTAYERAQQQAERMLGFDRRVSV